ncbi:MAG: ABC transporter ATP-binding protein, partial [Chloroflexota bacterium]|nr:ABC transporter ATP-binding protein [Chloroflexota bacterium]
LRNLTNYALANLSLMISDGELLSILGPNGAGKTTLLNIVAGLIDYQGDVLFDGINMNDKSCQERQLSYLFQGLALFPHLTVAQNIEYGLRAKKRGKRRIESRVVELLRLTKIEHLKHRYPKNLSGGEKQRVALARSLAISPRVLLLDEPMNSLDRGTCECLRREIRCIQQERKITTVLVTHNLAEAEEISDRIVTMRSGKIATLVERKDFASLKSLEDHVLRDREYVHCSLGCDCDAPASYL